MSYPPKTSRVTIDISPIGNCQLETPGELTYAILQLALQYAKHDHAVLQEAIGAVESAKQELYRKYVNPASAQHEFDHGGIE
jgi:hypothetical protein